MATISSGLMSSRGWRWKKSAIVLRGGGSPGWPPGQPLVDVVGPGTSRAYERKVDIALHGEGEVPFGALGRLLDPLQRQLVLEQVDAMFPFEIVDQPFDDAVVKILSPQIGVAVCGQDMENSVLDFHDGDIERPPSHIENGDFGVGPGLEPVSAAG